MAGVAANDVVPIPVPVGESVTTWANAVTVTRTVVTVPFGLLAITAGSTSLLLAAYVVYWGGDIADGWLARRLHQETRIGAVLDIISDRACSAVLVCALTLIRPDLWLPLAVFLIQFVMVDGVLSLSFLRWQLLTPNHFHLVDQSLWRLNWSQPAKVANTAGVVFAIAGGPSLALVVALAQLALKVWSARRLLSLHADQQ